MKILGRGLIALSSVGLLICIAIGNWTALTPGGDYSGLIIANGTIAATLLFIGVAILVTGSDA